MDAAGFGMTGLVSGVALYIGVVALLGIRTDWMLAATLGLVLGVYSALTGWYEKTRVSGRHRRPARRAGRHRLA